MQINQLFYPEGGLVGIYFFYSLFLLLFPLNKTLADTMLYSKSTNYSAISYNFLIRSCCCMFKSSM